MAFDKMASIRLQPLLASIQQDRSRIGSELSGVAAYETGHYIAYCRRVNDERKCIKCSSTPTLLEYCGEEVQRQELQGTYIISPDQSCRTEIGNTFIEPSLNSTDISYKLSIISMPNLRGILKTREKQLDLRNVDFSDVKEICSI
ncbi:unnamed protein product [Leptidea sinapis]|uniref:Uncharacterized protein n=1 Tax=Leptidea sinapis TaxID=189913 RepID=A0A5E4QNM2_9NEOP|nr:unnamed protein product [Leptidea sinapis]